jgi:hypothetical protein
VDDDVVPQVDVGADLRLGMPLDVDGRACAHTEAGADHNPILIAARYRHGPEGGRAHNMDLTDDVRVVREVDVDAKLRHSVEIRQNWHTANRTRLTD